MPRKSDKVLERLHRLHPKEIDLSLGRMNDLLKKLGHPERKLPPVIHVAGTNGKGSTVAYLRAILEAANLRVHVYSSPHLVRFAERIRIAGRLIDEDKLFDHLVDCEKISGNSPVTYFEITTAVAFTIFADYPADVLLLEVGLGGRLDATNVIDHPLSTIITPISIDHEKFLGSDTGSIAREKAGIARSKVPFVIAPQSARVTAVLRDHARKVGALLFDSGHWSVDLTDNGFDYHDDKGHLSLPRPNLEGSHQIANAGLAVACLRYQDKFLITPDHITRGLTSVIWPARLQDITASRYGNILPEGSELWLDGGHNPAAGQILANYFRTPDPRPLSVICAMMATKDVRGFLKPLSLHLTRLLAVTIPDENSYTSEEIVHSAQAINITADCSVSAHEALLDIQTRSGGTAVRVLICGSLYLAGYILAQNNLLPD